MPFIGSLLVSLLSSYVAKLATAEFADYVIRQVAHAIVRSTKNDKDDQWLAAVEAAIDGKPLPKIEE